MPTEPAMLIIRAIAFLHALFNQLLLMSHSNAYTFFFGLTFFKDEHFALLNNTELC